MKSELDAIEKIKNTLYENHQINKKKNVFFESSQLFSEQLFEDPFVGKVLREYVEDESNEMIIESLIKHSETLTVPISLLNLFSGSGHLLWELAKKKYPLKDYFNIINVDISEVMLKDLQSGFGYTAKMTYLKTDVKKTNLSNDSIEFIACHGGLRYLHLSEYDIFFCELLRIVNESGAIFISESEKSVVLDALNVLNKQRIIPSVQIRKIKQFRCTTFYLLYKHYSTNSEFKNLIDCYVSKTTISLEEFFVELAGYKHANMYGLMFNK